MRVDDVVLADARDEPMPGFGKRKNFFEMERENDSEAVLDSRHGIRPSFNRLHPPACCYRKYRCDRRSAEHNDRRLEHNHRRVGYHHGCVGCADRRLEHNHRRLGFDGRRRRLWRPLSTRSDNSWWNRQKGSGVVFGHTGFPLAGRRPKTVDKPAWVLAAHDGWGHNAVVGESSHGIKEIDHAGDELS
jgi:hypothetical protein